MAGPYRVSLLFNFNGSGWSESWYYSSNNAFGAADRQASEKMANARNGLVGYGVNLEAIRVNDISTPRLVQTFPLGKSTAQGSEAPDQPAASWFAVAQGAGGRGRRQVWLRNIPDDWVKWEQAFGKWLPQGNLNQNFEAFKRIITADPWRLQVIAPVNGVGTKTLRVKEIGATAAGLALLTLAEGQTFGSTDTLIVSGLKKPLSKLNGVYAPGAYTLGNTSVTLNKTVATYDVNSYRTGGNVRLRLTSLVPVADMRLERPGTRRTGRAFFVPAGRR